MVSTAGAVEACVDDVVVGSVDVVTDVAAMEVVVDVGIDEAFANDQKNSTPEFSGTTKKSCSSRS